VTAGNLEESLRSNTTVEIVVHEYPPFTVISFRHDIYAIFSDS